MIVAFSDASVDGTAATYSWLAYRGGVLLKQRKRAVEGYAITADLTEIMSALDLLQYLATQQITEEVVYLFVDNALVFSAARGKLVKGKRNRDTFSASELLQHACQELRETSRSFRQFHVFLVPSAGVKSAHKGASALRHSISARLIVTPSANARRRWPVLAREASRPSPSVAG